MNDVGAVEDLLTEVAALAPRRVGETCSLWVPNALTLEGNLLAQDVGMAIVLDALLAKGFFPAGFEPERGGRRYKYRFEGLASSPAMQ